MRQQSAAQAVFIESLMNYWRTSSFGDGGPMFCMKLITLKQP
jgi:hypothetical protein